MILNPTDEGAIMVATFVWTGVVLLFSIAVASAYIKASTNIEVERITAEEESPRNG